MELVAPRTPRVSPEIHRQLYDMVDITSADEFAFSFFFEDLVSKQEIKRWVVEHIEHMIVLGITMPEGEVGVITWPDNLKQRAIDHVDKIREIAETITTYSSMHGRPITGVTSTGEIHFHVGELEVPLVEIPFLTTSNISS